METKCILKIHGDPVAEATFRSGQGHLITLQIYPLTEFTYLQFIFLCQTTDNILKSAAEARYQIMTAILFSNCMAKCRYVFFFVCLYILSSSPFLCWKSTPAMHCLCNVSSRMKAMVEVPRRPTMQEIQARRKSSVTESRLSKRLGMSLPNLGEDQTIIFQRNTLLTIMSNPGEIGDEV